MWRASTHPLFDGDYYLKKNGDVAQAGINPLLHYLMNGDAEGRDPHPLFSVAHYRAEGQLADPRRTALEDYLANGAQRGRTPYPLFDYDLYRECVDRAIPNPAILADLAANLEKQNRQQFLHRASEQALKSCSRSALMGPLVKENSLAGPRPTVETRCDVVIPVKNAVDWLDRCLRHLIPASDDSLVGSILVVDDSSSEQSSVFLAKLAQRDRRISVVRIDSGTGFAAACNAGFRHSLASHVLFLNSDCLLNGDTIAKMLAAFSAQSRVGIACAVANNAANVSIPIAEGCSFVSMNNLVGGAFADTASSRYPEICTTVGHCLMVSRECYEATGGMDESWGLGYGEESDFHLRARARGYLGVLVTDAYVYHFGGGTFRHVKAREALQRVNHTRFMRTWGDAFVSYSRLTGVSDPIHQLEHIVEKRVHNRSVDKCDVLFILPCIISGIGGIHVVLDLCNHLIMRGMDARVLVLDSSSRPALVGYAEPLYFNPFFSDSIDDFLKDYELVPSVVVSSLYSTVPPAWKFAKERGATLVNFVQGFEVYFDSGKPFDQVRDSYFLAETSLVTSSWLATKVRNLAVGCDVRQFPLGVNRFLFYPRSDADLRGGEKLRVGLVLRASVDKGQFVLRELVDMLMEHGDKFNLTIFKHDSYPLVFRDLDQADVRCISLPANRQVIADALREVDVFIDASLHEGYGLFPLEAMSCGACVVASDSGGVRQFLKNGVTGRLVVAVNKPEVYFQSILELFEDRSLLLRLRRSGIEESAAYEEVECFDGYWSFFASHLRGQGAGPVANVRPKVSVG